MQSTKYINIVGDKIRQLGRIWHSPYIHPESRMKGQTTLKSTSISDEEEEEEESSYAQSLKETERDDTTK